MENIIRYVLLLIKPYWNKIAITYNETSVKMSDLFKEAIELSNSFKLGKRDNKVIIALCANNSINWVISFLSIIISNNTIVIISSSMNLESILHILTVSEVDILITDLNIDFKGRIININRFIYSKNPKELRTFELFRFIARRYILGKQGDDIIIYTPNTLKEIKLSFNKMFYLLRELKIKEIFKSNTDYLAYAEFSYNYVIGLLLPLISNTRIIIPDYSIDYSKPELSNISYNFYHHINNKKIPTVILNANQFTQIFKEVKKTSYSIKELFKVILAIRSYKSLLKVKKLIIKNRLNKLLPNLEKLIILNSSIALHTEQFLKEIKFPYTITYGTIETFGIATYSNPYEFKIESVGKGIINNIIIIDNIICDIDRGICRYRRYDKYSLNDFGIKDKDGNIYFICRSDDYSIRSRKIEEIVKEIPFILDCVLFKALFKTEKPYLLVRIDYEQTELMKINTNEEIINIINKFISNLPISISKIIIWTSDFKKDTYDRIVNV
jgi:hypothetical protein